MSDAEDIERIRERKRRELLDDGTSDESESTPAEPIHIEGNEHLQEVVETHDVVLLEFYADWCGPCKMMEPVLADLAAETDAAIAKVDVDANQGLAARHQVRGVPTIVLFRGGDVLERVTGARDRNALEGLLDSTSGN